MFPSGLLPNLRNLAVIGVEVFDKMEEITAAEEKDEGRIVGEEGNSGNRCSIECSLPKLLDLKLRNLSKLKAFAVG